MKANQSSQSINSGRGRITAEELRSLIEQARAPALSVLMPLDPNPNSSDKVRLTLKNLIDEARRQLASWPGVDPDQMVTSLRALLSDDTFWRGYGRGYAHYVSANGWSAACRLPFEVAPQVHVNEQFSVRALLGLLGGTERFCVLAVSQNRVQLYAGDRLGLVASDALVVPGSLEEAMQNFKHSNDLNTHGGGPFGAGVHGQGSRRDYRESELATFLRGVDDSVCQVLNDQGSPSLVLAMVEETASLYRTLTRYPRIADAAVAGNPDYVPVTELHAKAWSAVEPVFLVPRVQALERFRESAGSALVSTGADAVVAGAGVGRVEALLIQGLDPVWGTYEAGTATAEIHADPQPHDEDLVNRAAIETIAHGGSVYTDVSELGTPLAALFRY